MPTEAALGRQKPPDLQELVRAHGTWDRIPPEAWCEYDRKVRAWQAAIRDDNGKPRTTLHKERRGEAASPLCAALDRITP